MSELKIKDNIIIDDVECVLEKLESRTGYYNIDINDIKDFINNEPGTIYYVDEKFNAKIEPDNTRYLWLDTGFEENGKPIFISLLSSYGDYVGHYTGEYKFLTKTITNYFPQNTRYVNDNIRKFEIKYDRQVQSRLVKHLTEKYDDLAGECSEYFTGYDAEKEEEVQPLKKEPVKQEISNYGDKEYYSSIELAKIIREQLLVDKWQTLDGFERYLKIIGSRIWQLVQENKSEYYVINKTKSVIVNTGLLDIYGTDIKVMYRINLTSNTYTIFQLILSKQDFIKNEFTKEQANTEIKPIDFLNGETFNATIDEFDINTRSLMHIIRERRDRFPDNIQEISDDKLAQRIDTALKLGLKMQERDKTYVKPSYSGKTHSISWAMPLHINNEFSDEPELVLVVSKQGEFYEIKTVLPYDDIVKDRLTAMELYAKLW